MNRKRFFGKYRLAALCVALLCIAAITFASAKRAGASGDLDYIREYEITVDVNEDGTLTMQYHIAWEVLDSDSEGPAFPTAITLRSPPPATRSRTSPI